ncbi:phage terminase large subunit-like protein [Azorhizobium sp. AG788]|uniref:terminase large subunit n=1 Tax=Azorhizobium sp. AG788 TaxID=2183897 RepID=UPI00105CDC99|nr:terminase large subunit [Azorhizobium sp. AG788]TDT94539.1 phage terminase large subunit-like protein [Azorhizobium sp. AG788]
MTVPADQTTAYAQAVAAGESVAGPYVRAACARHLRDLAEGEARGLSWDLAGAERAIAFFRDVLTVTVEEKDEFGDVSSRAVPFVLSPWQAFIVGSLFGWRKGGFRRFRRAYVEIGKGNGKSPLAAGIGHYMLTAFRKLEAEVYSAATDLDQATILFRDACAMFERSRPLRARLTARGENPIYQLDYKATRSFFKPISAEKRGKSGIRPHCALIDEVHEHRDNSVIEMLRAGTKGNQEALIFEITNSGFDKKSTCWFEHEMTVKIVTGEIENDGWFGFIASLDEDDDPFEDEACWIKANPNLGISIHLPFIREQVAEAKGMPSKEGLVRRLHFCQWTDSETSAIPSKLWLACVKEFDPEELTARGVPCFGGLDLSRANDLTAFTLTWLLDASPDQWRFASKTWFWTPKDTLLERSKRDRAPYDLWVREGLMEAVPGKRISYSRVATALGRICSIHNPVQIGCDDYGLENLAEHLTLQELQLPCVVHPQGFKRRIVDEDEARPDGAEQISLWMPDSILKLEAALLEERIMVFPNSVMNMCSRAVVYKSNLTGHRMFDKDKASGRIDGMVSLAMSIGVATVVRTTTAKSFWETA